MIKKLKPDHLKYITESIPEYFFVYDIDNDTITYLSDSFQKYRSSDIEGAKMDLMRDMVHKNYRKPFDEIFNKIKQGQLMQDEELQMINAEVGEKWISVKTYPITSENSRMVAGHVLNITNKVLIHNNLKKEAGELEQVVHIMAHDLRSPLGSIRNLLELQKEAEEEKDYKKVNAYNSIASRIAGEMDMTINSMIEMIALSSEKFILQKAPTNIGNLIQAIVENLTFEFEHKNISFHSTFPSNDIVMHIDPVKCRLVIQNLLSNAIKFTNPGGKIKMQLLEGEEQVSIIISDDGIGIPEDKKAQIFEKFTPLKRKGTSGERSTGLGLSIVKKIIDIHEGTVQVESKENEGTTFTVTLPRIRG